MAAIILPTSPTPRVATPRPLDFGGWQTPIAAGPETYLGRLGNRWAMDVQTPRLKPNPDGRLWASALTRAIGQLVRLPVPQPWMTISAPGAPIVNGAGQTGDTPHLTGFIPGYKIWAGQFVSFTDGTYLYLHQATQDTTANGSGQMQLNVWPMLRASPANLSTVQVVTPLIEGRLMGSDKGWTMGRARVDGLSFTIAEVR